MKKKIIQILSILLLSQFAFGQSNATKMMIEYLNGEPFEIDSLKSILGISNYNEGNWSVDRVKQKELMVWNFFEREIDFDNQQFILEYQDQEDFRDYEVSIQYKENNALIIIVNREGLRKSKLLIKKISDDIESFLISYNKRYRTNLSVRDIKKDFIKPFEFGYACSVGGSPTDKFFEMMKAVNSKEETKLIEWLESPNINLRLFGAVGIQWLEYGGRKIKEEEKMIIQFLRDKNYQINSCSGCSPETNTIKQLMDDEWLKNFYDEYKKMGWFK